MSVRAEDRARPGIEQVPPVKQARDEPRRLSDPEDPQIRAEREAKREADREAERQRLSRLRYSVAALIVVDLIVGTWIYLHAPEALPTFSLTNFAVLGVSGVMQLLPPEEREALKRRSIEWMRRRLSAARAPSRLALLVGVLLAVAAFSSSVRVRGSAGATAELRVVDGSESNPNAAAMRAADTMRLAQAGGEVVARRRIWPLGQSVWAYTGSHVSRGDRTALPWRPVRWTYPDDFDEQVTLFVLPMTSAVGTLNIQKPEFVLRDLAHREILRSALTGNGARVQFSDRGVDLDALAGAWTARYRDKLVPADSFALGADSILVIGLLAPNDTMRRNEALKRHDDAVQSLGVIPDRVKAWRSAIQVKPARPLHLGEKVRYEFDHAGTTVGPFELVLDRNPYFLLIDAAAVDRPNARTDP